MISIKKYTEKLNNIWDDFIFNSNNGTIFHTQQFLSYHQNKKFTNHSLLFFDKDILLAVLPASIIKNNNQKILCSHPGASFGGMVYSQNLNFITYNNIISCLEQYCIKKKFDIIRLINTPNIYHKTKDDSFNYLLQWREFIQKETYISHYLENNFEIKTLTLLHKRKQRYIKNIIQNNKFSYKADQSFNLFYPILLQSKKLFKTFPTHSLEELFLLKKEFPEKIHLLLFYDYQTVVGGSVLFFTTNNTVLIFYNAINPKYKQSHLSTYQLYECMRFAKKNNKKIIDFGVSHTPETKNPLDPKFSLIQFKEHFSAKGVLRIVYEKALNE
jgi:hypothetical protein